MNDTQIIVDGVVTVTQNIVFSAMIVSCVYLITKYKSQNPKQPKQEVAVEKKPTPKKPSIRKTIEDGFDDGEEEYLDKKTGELIVRKKRSK